MCIFCNFFSEDYICTCLWTKWLPLVQFLGFSSLFQWLGSSLKCQRMMQILANYEKEPTDHNPGQTGLAGGNWNCMCASMIPLTADRSQFWPVSLDTDHLILFFLLTDPFPPAYMLTLTLSSMLQFCCKCCSLFFLFKSFFQSILQYFYQVKCTKVRNISLLLLTNICIFNSN